MNYGIYRRDETYITGRHDIDDQLNKLTGKEKTIAFDNSGLFGRAVITLQQEPRKGTENLYWYAYRRIGKKIKKAYIGRELTAKKMREAWNKLVIGEMGKQ